MNIATDFQTRVDEWVKSCFGELASKDKTERSHRFIEEALELVQASGCQKSDILDIIEYVYSRPKGEISQEAGGVIITLAALCNANEINMKESGEIELNRVWIKIDSIREKWKRKNPNSALP